MTTKKDIESTLMRGADTLRDTIDAANYKDYVLPMMFVKYLSDSYTDAVEELSKQYSGIRLERQKNICRSWSQRGAHSMICISNALLTISGS